MTTFDSMQDLTNYVERREKNDLVFSHLSERDLKQIEYFAHELDVIYSDLLDLSNRLDAYKHDYNLYCSNLLKLCDEKDKLSELFIDYYDEYIVNEKKKSNGKKSIYYCYAVPVQNRFSLLE